MAASLHHPEAERERIRDLSRYYCTVDRPVLRLVAADDQDSHVDIPDDETPPDIRLSSDITLTALAQLGVYRFGCNRSYVSIIDGVHQYIIAEATKSISLRDKDRHDPDDGIYLGVRTLDLIWGVCPHSIALFTGQDPSKVVDSANVTANLSRFIVRDFTKEDFYKDRPYVVGWPHFRFYAEVPIYSPAGYVLGSFCIVDDHPRDHFGDAEVATLREIADAISGHLEHVRIAHYHRRAENLVKGLTSFVKGHSEFDPTEVPPVTVPSDPLPSTDSEVPPWVEPETSPEPSEPPIGRPSTASVLTGELTSLFSAVTCSEQSTSSTSVNPARATTTDEDLSDTREAFVGASDRAEFPAVSVRTPASISDNLARIFARASATLRDSMDLDGVLFLDASRSNSGVVRPGDAGSWEPLPTTANPEFLADPYPSPVDLPGVGSLSKASERPCDVLGEARHPSTTASTDHNPVTEDLLNRLVAFFPHGQFINLHEGVAAAMPATASQPATPSEESSDQFVENQRTSVADLCRELQQCFPEAYCVLFYPLWDWNRSRWLAGTLVWTQGSDRALDMEELHYFKVFGDSIISEVARIDWATIQRSKSDFISSVSHELRSPLHGILASAELLQSSPLDASQAHWMSMVQSCGLTLLDTLNHLLDFAKINNLTTGEDAGNDKPSNSRSANLLTVFDLDALVEEVTDVQYTGQRLGRTINPLTRRLMHSPADAAIKEGELTVVVRVQDRQAWTVQSVAGAWRRIVMNLLGNSLKWTKTGFIEVSLSKARRKSDPQSIFAHLTVTDTGRGIAPDFLKHKLFSPFAQEDSLSEGLGLGFSIVRQLVSSLDGHINVRSELGIGTQVDIFIPVRLLVPSDANGAPGVGFASPPALPMAPLRFSLVGFDSYPHPREVPTGILPAEAKRKLAIRSSLTSVLLKQPGWTLTQAESLADAKCEVAVIEEESLSRAMATSKLQPAMGAVGGYKFLLVLDSNQDLIRDTMAPNMIRVSQPFGPRKFDDVINRILLLYYEYIKNPTPCQTPLSPPTVDPTPELLQSMSPAPTPSPDSRQSNSIPSAKPLKDVHVLIVDDNDINLKILATFIRKLGCSYDTASNGLIALNTYKSASRRHDIVLMDISMPVMDGITSTEQIRRYEKKMGLIPTRIIAVTGLGSADQQQEALAAGVDEYLVKPVSLSGLKKVMKIT
ncbi:hybrid sensor histidine kinase/response regulator [Aspergillus homomorphus CBS 101889]|uniref:Two-component sensor protein histidine protein kinase n=1 Tax=Aspergillus homomorphus (strain CBS 101889) TaxID=1450537 RepID=A0A395HT13_ASPHC|nr:two-component sensor protein histidine protein kinase [Aspergillus homomorphus CBS 101889]RAL10686.1 two-component sensor protein histidine protein kinase [Aspergillus homomorphus CBS 101889]